MHKDTVFIVDDDASIRDSLSLLLSLHGFATASYANAEDFLAAVQADWQGCVVADIRMPGLSGLELQQALLQRAPRLPVIIITAHGDVAAARQAFLAHAVDFIEKPFHNEDLLSRVSRALELDNQLATRQKQTSAIAHRLAQLTQREREVMQLVVAGKLNKQVADQLDISMKTVEAHRARVMEKMGVRTLAELVKAVMSVS